MTNIVEAGNGELVIVYVPAPAPSYRYAHLVGQAKTNACQYVESSMVFPVYRVWGKV